MRGSERQRPDVVQLAKAFGRAADTKLATGLQMTRIEAIHSVMLDYNKLQKVANCKVEGDERTAVKFLAQYPEVWPILRNVWNDFRVRESPITASILAAPFVTAAPTGLTNTANPRWCSFLTPNASKLVLWVRRLDASFRARVDRARREGKAPSLQSRAVALPRLQGVLACTSVTCCNELAERSRPRLWTAPARVPNRTHRTCQGHYRETDNLMTFQVSMLWGSIVDEIKALVGERKFEELQGMFLRGSLDRDLACQVKLKCEDFELRSLGFLQTQEDVEMAAQASKSNTVIGEFRLLSVRLSAEQTAWQQHLAQVHAWRAKTHQAKIDLNTTIYNLRVAAVDAHCAAAFPIFPCEKTREAWGKARSASLFTLA